MSIIRERLDPRADNISKIESFIHIQRYKYAMNEIDGTILDIGCGLGYGSWMLSRTSNQIVAFDISTSAITYALKKYAGPKYSIADAQILPFKDSSFDYVIAFEIIEHLDSATQLLLEIYRVLKNEGVLILSTPNVANLQNRLKCLVMKKKKLSLLAENPTNPYHKREYLPREISTLLKSTGFKIITKRGQIISVPLVHWLSTNLYVNMGRFLPNISLYIIYKGKKDGK